MSEAIKPAAPYAATRSAALLTALSVLSPLSGLVMEMVLAWRFGASGTVDAFRIAALVLVLGTQLFFGYVLPHVVVPLFTEYRAKGQEREGWRLIFSIAIILSLVSLLFAGWVWFDPGTLVELLGPGLAASSREDAVLLIRCFSLVFPLMALSGVISGMLYVYRVFWLSAVAQLLPNLFVVLALVLAGSTLGAGALALGACLGYVALLFLFVYGLFGINGKVCIRLSECFKPGPSEGLLKALHLSIPLAATILIGQWSIIVINRVLSAMAPGTLAEFGYAWKLLALISLLPAGLATVVFPAFSEAHANDNSAEFGRLVQRALRMTLFLTLPLAVFLIVERLPVVSLIFERGGMTMAAVAETGLLFGILLIGAPASAVATTLGKVAFSMHDTMSSTAIALFTALAITALVPHAAEVAGVAGVVWVFSAISWGGTLLLLGYLIIRYRIISVRDILRYAGLLVVLCIGVALPVIAIRALFESYAPLSFSFALLELMLSGVISIVAGYALSQMLGVHESAEIARYIKWQFQQLAVTKKLGFFGSNRING